MKPSYFNEILKNSNDDIQLHPNKEHRQIQAAYKIQMLFISHITLVRQSQLRFIKN